MVQNTFAVALLTLSLTLVAACSSTETERALARKSQEPSVTFECSDQCSAFDGCEIMDASSCLDACLYETFTRNEISCLAEVSCTNEAFEACFDLPAPDGPVHRN